VTLAISPSDVHAAASRLRGVAHRTPVFTSRTANASMSAQLFFKCENLQRMGAFKFRGAYNTLSQFSAEQRARGALAFSSGNHAQAVALAARLLGMPALIVMPSDAPAMKIRATREYGAEVVLYDRYTQDREAVSRQLAEERRMTMVPPFNHAGVMAGQGTAALELVEQVREIDGGGLDLLLVCVGGGGLISGCAVITRHLLPGCRVIAVEPEAGNDVQQSKRLGRIVHIDVPRTIADGAQTQQTGDLTFPVIQTLVDDVVTVSDAQLVAAMRFFAERMKLVVEPTGALAAAAAFSGAVEVKGLRVGVIVSGGNVDLVRYAEFIGGVPRG
jgi:threonine dehydratase